MTQPLYHMYHEDNLTKDKLLADPDFVSDATKFLIGRENYTADELQDKELVYDQFMEHFRFQNVNEVTAIKDLMYAQDLDQDGKDRMGRLMQTYDRMGSDLGAKAYVDYLQGIMSAPSTYASLFSFGTAKAGSFATQQGIKFSLRKLLTQGRYGKDVLKKATLPVAIDTAAGGGTVLAQENTRVETNIKDEVDMKNVGLATGVSFLTSGLLTGAGSISGVKKDIQTERILRINQKKLKQRSEIVHKVKTSKLFNANNKRSDLAKQFETILKDSVRQEAREGGKAALEETIPEILETGKRLYKDRLLAKGEGIPLTFDEKALQNIAAAAVEIDEVIGNLKTLPKGGSTERFTSRLAKALTSDFENTLRPKLADILTKYNINWEDVGPLFAAQLSEAGTTLGIIGKLAKGKEPSLKDAYNTTLKELNMLDDALEGQGLLTGAYKKKLNKITKSGHHSFMRQVISDLFAKGRVGLMTIQLATTVRNTTNGLMRNYIYALDNVGSGLVNYAKGGYKLLTTGGDEDLVKHAYATVRQANAQMLSAFDSAYIKDMGIQSTSTVALFKVLGSKNFGFTDEMSRLLRELADIGEMTGAETGILKPVRALNKLNTMSDNMFKRAIFAREINKSLRANPLDIEGRSYNNVTDLLRNGYGNRIRAKDVASAIETALDFTYQRGGFRGVEGGFNNFADAFIKFGSTVGGSALVPFPRFMVNSFQFMYKHAPVLGLFNWGGIRSKSTRVVGKEGNPPVNSWDLSSEAIGEQLSGMALLYAMYEARVKFGDENTSAFEYKDPYSGGTFDARAMLGPFAPYALMADILYRIREFSVPESVLGVSVPEAVAGKKLLTLHDNDKVAMTRAIGVRESVEAITGSFGMAGTGLFLIDGLFSELQGLDTNIDVSRYVAKFLGNYFNTYTVGVGTLTDLVGTIDPEYRQLKSNASVNMWEYFFRQASRSIPMDAVADVGEFAGIDRDAFEFVDRRDRLASPTRSEGVKRFNPILKQLTGFTPREEKTFIEKELSRLQFDYTELAPRRIKGDPILSNDAVQAMGEYVEKEIANYIRSSEYKREESNIAKKYLLKEKINTYRTIARNMVLDPNSATTEAEVDQINRANYMKLSARDRRYRNVKYKEAFGYDRDLVEDEAWGFEP